MNINKLFLIALISISSYNSYAADNIQRIFLLLSAEHDSEVKELLDKGIDVNSSNKDGYTILMSAAFHGKTDIVNLLLERGADVNLRSKNGYTALLYVVHNGFRISTNHKNIIISLLEHGADVNSRSKNGYTALLCAIHIGDVDLVRVILEHDPDINIKDNNEQTALDLANSKAFELNQNGITRDKYYNIIDMLKFYPIYKKEKENLNSTIHEISFDIPTMPEALCAEIAKYAISSFGFAYREHVKEKAEKKAKESIIAENRRKQKEDLERHLERQLMNQQHSCSIQ